MLQRRRIGAKEWSLLQKFVSNQNLRGLFIAHIIVPIFDPSLFKKKNQQQNTCHPNHLQDKEAICSCCCRLFHWEKELIWEEQDQAESGSNSGSQLNKFMVLGKIFHFFNTFSLKYGQYCILHCTMMYTFKAIGCLSWHYAVCIFFFNLNLFILSGG